MASDLDTTAGRVGQAPSHYQGNGMTPFEVWDAYKMDPFTANAFKYLSRCNKKGSLLNDLEKALHYIQEVIVRWNDPESDLNWLNWRLVHPGRLTPENVVASFGLTGNVREATLHLLYWRSDTRPSSDLASAKRYVERAIKEVAGV